MPTAALPESSIILLIVLISPVTCCVSRLGYLTEGTIKVVLKRRRKLLIILKQRRFQSGEIYALCEAEGGQMSLDIHPRRIGFKDAKAEKTVEDAR